MRQRLTLVTLVCSLLFAVPAMGVMVYLASTKAIVIADVAQDEVDGGGGAGGQTGQALLFSHEQAGEEEKKGYLCIPMGSEIKAEDVVIENRYMDKELWLTLDGVDAEFYRANAIMGNEEKVVSGVCEPLQEGVRLRFLLTGVYEYRSILEGSNLYMEFLSPKEMYDRIVVIDPAYGETGDQGLQQKDVTAGIARKLRGKLDGGEIKAYYTRTDDSRPGEGSGLDLAGEVDADMLIRVETGFSADSGRFGTEAVYNPTYFIPEFGSIELADLLERQVSLAVEGRALGLAPAGEEDYVVKNAVIPAAAIRPGCLTNPEEAALLGLESYQERIAEGIYQAVLQAYELREQQLERTTG